MCVTRCISLCVKLPLQITLSFRLSVRPSVGPVSTLIDENPHYLRWEFIKSGRERVFFLFFSWPLSFFLHCFLGGERVFLFSYFLVFFYKFPPQTENGRRGRFGIRETQKVIIIAQKNFNCRTKRCTMSWGKPSSTWPLWTSSPTSAGLHSPGFDRFTL